MGEITFRGEFYGLKNEDSNFSFFSYSITSTLSLETIVFGEPVRSHQVLETIKSKRNC